MDTPRRAASRASSARAGGGLVVQPLRLEAVIVLLLPCPALLPREHRRNARPELDGLLAARGLDRGLRGGEFIRRRPVCSLLGDLHGGRVIAEPLQIADPLVRRHGIASELAPGNCHRSFSLGDESAHEDRFGACGRRIPPVVSEDLQCHGNVGVVAEEA